MAFTSHLDCIDAEQRPNAANEPVDDVAVIDVYGSRYVARVRFRPSADGGKREPRDPRLVEQAAECGMHIAGLEFEKKHRMHLVLSVYRTRNFQDCCSFELGIAC
ncbi:hypothetical protein I3J27_14365 [Bradyrhizobium xenonodulans]|uniref:Uncharacterized protein n=1 Tax=Bradyrhizobium xenonodulans TaxID=2736875 RepID=A0ABY7MUC7_9BRAD|nr:hypothetical protein [Bradyrhizobium xenonodulans]WBL81541.1 hypothetical protein I3J27_14365 [Bradyrhizobium xenonodulans]